MRKKSVITYFLYCEGFQAPNSENGKPALIAPLHVIRPINIPGNFSFSIAFGILPSPDMKTMEIKIVDPNGNEVHDTGVTPIPPSLLENSEEGFHVNNDIRNIAIEVEGNYKSVILIDGEIVGEYVLPVKEKKVKQNAIANT